MKRQSKGASPNSELLMRMLWLGQRLCVLADEGLKAEILREAHESSYSMHPGSTKMYRDLKGSFFVEKNER